MSKRTLLAVVGALLTVPAAAQATTVRPDRPRLLFSNGTGRGVSVATFKQRCTGSDPAYKYCASSLNGTGALNAAAKYLVTGDATQCATALAVLNDPTKSGVCDPVPSGNATCDAQCSATDAHCNISRNGGSMLQIAGVRDWCDGALAATDKAALEARIVKWIQWYLANYTASDVFHDDDTNVWNTIALGALTLAGTGSDAQAQQWLTQAETQWKTVILPAMAYEADWWHEGMTYALGSVADPAMFANAWSIATDEDMGAWIKSNAGDLFEGYFRMLSYAMRPDYDYVYWGDTQSNKQSIQLFSRGLVDSLNYGEQSPLGQALAIEITANVPAVYDYPGTGQFWKALYYDDGKDGTATPRATLPTAAWLSKTAADVAVMRSGWGAGDAFVWVSCGDYFGAHGHDEAGAFQVFRHAILSGSDGTYDSFDTPHWDNYYSQHSVHANTLAVYQPGEFFPNSQTLNGQPSVNDGGQRPLRRLKDGSAFANPDLATYLKNKTSGAFYETGNLKTFEHAQCHDYVACDVTAAYSSPGFVTDGNTPKVDEVTRQFVYLRPDLLLVFDRVNALDPSYEKRFLLHAINAPAVSGSTATVVNGQGKLVAQTLLPSSASLNVVTNFTVEGKPWPPSAPDKESGGTRIEVVPKQPQARDYFLHVLQMTDATDTVTPASQLAEDAISATATIAYKGGSYVVKFDKTGALGGHLTVTEPDGTKCDEDLGAQGSGPGPDGGVVGPDGGPVGDDGGGPGGDDGGANGAGGGAGSSGGCGCAITGGSAGDVALLVGVGMLAIPIVRRRRRH
ncbi:MAG TPA: MYXO-CTERM sorting domain-containing protein [Polyangiaceae bacterium]